MSDSGSSTRTKLNRVSDSGTLKVSGWSWKMVGTLPCLGTHPPPHRNQVVSESVQGNRVDAATADKMVPRFKSCDQCVEEDLVCKCPDGGDFEIIKSVVTSKGGGGGRHGKAKSSFTHSVINMIGMLIGLGQLSVPYALENGGWTSAFLLVGLGIICAYSSHIIGKCLHEKPNSRNFQEIGEHAFGIRGKLIASIFIYLEIFLALVSYTISLNDNLRTVFFGAHLVFPWLHLSTCQVLTTIAVFVALPSLWLRDLSSISFLSSAGIFMSLLIFFTLVWTAAFGNLKGNQRIPILQIHNIPGISGLYFFSYAGHVVFPNIYRAMEDPSQFTKVSITSFSIVTLLYTALAFTGATLFGPGVNSQITLSMPPHQLATKIALWATVLTPMTKYALEFAPIAMQLEGRLPSSMGSRMKMIIRGSTGSFLLLGILALALSLPYFEYVLGLTGSLLSVSISIILPSAFYIKICWTEISKPTLIFNVFLIAIGTVFGVVGTISSATSLVERMQRDH